MTVEKSYPPPLILPHNTPILASGGVTTVSRDFPMAWTAEWAEP